jgi:hypothetical protein
MKVKEVWKECFFGYYAISSMGRVKRVRSGHGTKAGRICTRHLTKDGYVIVPISVRGSGCNHYVHKLVAEIFIRPRPPGKEVNHKDGDKHNCSVGNLEYITHRENMDHATRLGLRVKGSRCTGSKLTATKVRRIRRLFATGNYKKIELARRFGVSGPSMLGILSGKYWAWLK